MRLTALLVSSLIATSAIAQPCTQAVPVTSPCEGVVLPSAWALEAAECKRILVPLCRAEKDQLAAQLRLARFDLDQARLSATRQWYEHPLLWVGVGVVASALVVAGVQQF